MSADDEHTPTDASLQRPRAIPFTAAATMAFAFFGVQRAEAQLTLARVARLPPPRDLPGAVVHATWRTAQDHRRLTSAVDVSTLLVSVLLFIAGSRVLFRPRGGGWLWRQALLGSVVVGAATVAVDHALRAGRIAALRALLTNPATRIPLPTGLHADEVGRMTFGISLGASWVTLALLCAALYYVSRERARAYLDA
ncbi:MAG: hypothetical protein Q8S73_00220 [Deltaproteobacteria bacterium]|nr:hypothetical protein [Myxococcales bacterium]MDP3212496.1 hypothetical protein [Deltaproteobacteria bacterium]